MKRLLAAFLLIGLAFAGGVEINHLEVVRLCRGQNELRRETVGFVDQLAAPAPIPKTITAAGRSVLEQQNAQRLEVRRRARGSFKIRGCTG